MHRDWPNGTRIVCSDHRHCKLCGEDLSHPIDEERNGKDETSCWLHDGKGHGTHAVIRPANLVGCWPLEPAAKTVEKHVHAWCMPRRPTHHAGNAQCNPAQSPRPRCIHSSRWRRPDGTAATVGCTGNDHRTAAASRNRNRNRRCAAAAAAAVVPLYAAGRSTPRSPAVCLR
jgi:hypothetical protein